MISKDAIHRQRFLDCRDFKLRTPTGVFIGKRFFSEQADVLPFQPRVTVFLGFTMESYRRLLLEEFERRKARSRLYSMRPFARLLKMEPSNLRKILRGERCLWIETAVHFGDALDLETETFEEFMKSVILAHISDADCRKRLALLLSGASSIG